MLTLIVIVGICCASILFIYFKEERKKSYTEYAKRKKGLEQKYRIEKVTYPNRIKYDVQVISESWHRKPWLNKLYWVTMERFETLEEARSFYDKLMQDYEDNSTIEREVIS